MTKCFKWTLKIYWRVRTIWLVLRSVPGGASQDKLLDDLFEDIYQIVMYLLWSQSVLNSHDECYVACTVITALCSALLSFQLLSFLWKTVLLVSYQHDKPRCYPQSVPSGTQLYLAWQGDTDARNLERGSCSASAVLPVPCGGVASEGTVSSSSSMLAFTALLAA